mmetsp:Transcript_18285/g.26258  ORF Transcript_18285/g.26258 Transcript_18285/m.26258 type:complete len:82 (+) Transcript_18285:52-297(+)|eukprot:CAMPEP_0202442732 /NCGR_PEP_ID=MMETSP1360-20130828/2110_1 /ASSEMBLY_ACC=CAM_ASM_000848 /TAXON_ID=515479 /ORGANISM="Licmophora paradoxa, Strain CCMP2313" /LENGTH=81 /DNA_ID=CAMNT_0049058175 /DNA_START=52 /DNA_END=297 /DNA_ORIENTATION=-
MDFEGQKLVEILLQVIITFFGAVGWILGYIKQDFFICFYAWLVGVVLSIIICVPDWPFFNRNPIKWTDSVPEKRKKEKKNQ